MSLKLFQDDLMEKNKKEMQEREKGNRKRTIIKLLRFNTKKCLLLRALLYMYVYSNPKWMNVYRNQPHISTHCPRNT